MKEEDKQKIKKIDQTEIVRAARSGSNSMGGSAESRKRLVGPDRPREIDRVAAKKSKGDGVNNTGPKQPGA
jgi:hypothetical protein